MKAFIIWFLAVMSASVNVPWWALLLLMTLCYGYGKFEEILKNA